MTSVMPSTPPSNGCLRLVSRKKFEVGIVKTIEWYLNNQDWVEEVTSGDYQKYYERMYGKK